MTPPPARRATQGRGVGQAARPPVTPVLATALEIIDRDGAEQLIIEAAEQRGRHQTTQPRNTDQPAARR